MTFNPQLYLGNISNILGQYGNIHRQAGMQQAQGVSGLLNQYGAMEDREYQRQIRDYQLEDLNRNKNTLLAANKMHEVLKPYQQDVVPEDVGLAIAKNYDSKQDNLMSMYDQMLKDNNNVISEDNAGLLRQYYDAAGTDAQQQVDVMSQEYNRNPNAQLDMLGKVNINPEGLDVDRFKLEQYRDSILTPVKNKAIAEQKLLEDQAKRQQDMADFYTKEDYKANLKEQGKSSTGGSGSNSDLPSTGKILNNAYDVFNKLDSLFEDASTSWNPFAKSRTNALADLKNNYTNIFLAIGESNPSVQEQFIKTTLNKGNSQTGSVDIEAVKSFYKNQDVLNINASGTQELVNKGEMVTNVLNNPERYRIINHNGNEYFIDFNNQSALRALATKIPAIASKLEEERNKLISPVVPQDNLLPNVDNYFGAGGTPRWLLP